VRPEARYKTKGPYPHDLRDDGPSGEVTRYWDLGAFSWHGTNSARGGSQTPFVYIAENYIRLSQEAVRLAEFRVGDRIAIGINNTFLALRKDQAGLIARSSGKSEALLIAATKIIKAIKDAGWPLPCRAYCTLDKKNNMLVARNPVLEATRHARSK